MKIAVYTIAKDEEKYALRWAQNTHVDLTGFDNLAAFKRRMEEDSGVRAALRAEGLA